MSKVYAFMAETSARLPINVPDDFDPFTADPEDDMVNAILDLLVESMRDSIMGLRWRYVEIEKPTIFEQTPEGYIDLTNEAGDEEAEA